MPFAGPNPRAEKGKHGLRPRRIAGQTSVGGAFEAQRQRWPAMPSHLNRGLLLRRQERGRGVSKWDGWQRFWMPSLAPSRMPKLPHHAGLSFHFYPPAGGGTLSTPFFPSRKRAQKRTGLAERTQRDSDISRPAVWKGERVWLWEVGDGRFLTTSAHPTDGGRLVFSHACHWSLPSQ